MKILPFLKKKYPHVTRKELLQFFRDKKIFVGNRPAAKSSFVTGREDLRLPPAFHQPVRFPTANADLKITVVFEDDAILIVSKPSGIPSVPHSFDEAGTLVNFLVARNPQLVGVGGRPLEPGMVHRLDTFTSGLMVAVKTQESFEKMKKQFQEQKVLKEYLALVEGIVDRPGEILNPIGSHPKNSRKVKVYPGGAGETGLQEAMTKYSPVQMFSQTTLLRVQIVTGVRHQIRAHLAYLGHPVVGDKLYGSKMAAGRMCLHALKLGFFHPVTEKWIEFEDPITFPAPPPPQRA